MDLLFVNLALELFRLDLAVKDKVEARPVFEEGTKLAGGRIQLKKLHNDGMAGGIFSGHMPAIIRFSSVMAVGVAGMFVRLLMKEGHEVEKTGFAFLMGGAMSNLYDRCRRGYVVDYISFRTPWKRLSDLVFNLSDFFILIGTVLICLERLKDSRE